MSGSPDSSNYHVKCGANGEADSYEEPVDSNYYFSRITNRLSNGEEKIISLASIRLDNPAFVTALQLSHVRRKSSFVVSLFWCMYIHCGPCYPYLNHNHVNFVNGYPV
jgi:hypothetical protein